MSASASAAAVGAALALAACGGGSGGASTAATATAPPGASSATIGGPTLSPGAVAIAAAVLRSGQEPGEKLKLAVSLSTASLGTVSIAGDGTYDNTAQSGQLAATVSLQISDSGFVLGTIGSLLSGLTLHAVTHGATLYAQLPAALGELLSSYTGGKPWLELDLAQLASDKQFGPLAQILNTGGLTNPLGALDGLLKDAAQDFHRVGAARVDGVATTEYQAKLNLADLETALSAAQRRQLQTLAGSAAATAIPYAIYIDGAGRVRRVAFSVSPTVEGARAHVSFQADILAYGPEAAPQIPAAGQTVNLANVLSNLG